MLDAETKRRIDSCRDILVGKVPDPKSQVEQITIALIYKFMDDMDAEAEELGGSRSFFTGDYAKYGWAKLMRSGLGGHETLNLYAEAIAKMPENPGIPALFRDIFKNAYLPYRDPETLRSFLKEIDVFSYDHSEKLGDAFEYLLSVLGSQGDAGQFRTPRHIIDFMVEVMNPQKNESLLDPACGTAGFLISAWKHILKSNTKVRTGDQLTPDERTNLAANIHGYDISPDMVRLSLVNLYLHGFSDPHVVEYDTLTSEEKWNETADVILANPPFMSPKGGIKPHKRFSIQAARSEVLFVDYIAEHLSPNGRAAIVVPEGIIFQSQTAYKSLRKLLVEKHLVAVISLPAGVFNPYSGVKTSILILDKRLAKTSDSIAFLKVENDGFGLGAQRRAFDKNDLPHIKAELFAYLQALRSQQPTAELQLTRGLIVPKEKIAENGDYNLSGERYRDTVAAVGHYPPQALGDLLEIQSGFPFKSELFNEGSGFPIIRIRDIKPNRTVTKYTGEYDSAFLVQNGDLLIGMDGEFNSVIWNGGPALLNQRVSKLHSFKGCLKEYVALLIPKRLQEIEDGTYAVTVKHISGKQISAIEIPLPPLEVQKKIVAEIEGYQKVINGARAVLDYYHPHIPIHPDWPMVEMGEVCDVRDGTHDSPKYVLEGYPLITSKNLKNGFIDFTDVNLITREDLEAINKRSKVDAGDLLMPMIGTIGNPVIADVSREYAVKNVALIKFPPGCQVDNRFLKDVLDSAEMQNRFEQQASGSTQRFISLGFIRKLQIPLPPLATQQTIAAEIETEQALVAANRELIERFEKKIQTTLDLVWGEDK
ncbi:MAG: N-6 DNA methylase [Gallionella sp.]|nr:N-6 DNA methylase [Gallionella sp.]